jgi:hypothetical protein
MPFTPTSMTKDGAVALAETPTELVRLRAAGYTPVDDPQPETDPAPEPETDPAPEPETDPAPEPETDPAPEPETAPDAPARARRGRKPADES